MSAHTIRPATSDDIAAITPIYAEQVLNGTATYELTAPDEAQMLARYEAMAQKGYPYLVAEDEQGTVVGYAYANAFRSRPAYDWTLEDSIYLAPASRGKGVGRSLLTRLMEVSTELGFRQMVAVIGGAENLGSIRIHERAGFRHVGTMTATGLKFGRWIDTVLMQTALGEGGDTVPARSPFAPPPIA